MKTKRISCETARSICIVKTLAKLGHFPSRKSEKEAWFLSPLRSKTQASFKVSFRLNRWYDFGIGRGGNVIDLVCLISNCSVAEALDYLSEGIPVSQSYADLGSNRQKTEPKNKILKVLPIEHGLLRKYLSSRKIPFEIARAYCREIRYECLGRTFFALGLQNHLGGWELRNLYCKSSTAPKSYTYLKKGRKKLIVLEGMFDLLSLAVIIPKEIERADLIILNSLSFIPEALPLFKNYKTVTLYLDRDSAGIEAAENILRNYPQYQDGSSLYEGYKDLNEMLVKNIDSKCLIAKNDKLATDKT
ncbi:toprim domain-containing protein [Salinimicrobium sp. TIG7-5_MAKvit]|uniref:toprim domain-containing protein n=1 Tax=Salinimicrobium sp. TIG7-5_MAKvit TaxID=3121289 RepID=UPI003C6E4BF7